MNKAKNWLVLVIKETNNKKINPYEEYHTFAQNTRLLPKQRFSKIINQYQSDKYVIGLDSWTHLQIVIFCHFFGADSVRSISYGLIIVTGNFNLLGLQCAPGKSSVSYMNNHRDWRLFRNLYFRLYNYSIWQKFTNSEGS